MKFNLMNTKSGSLLFEINQLSPSNFADFRSKINDLGGIIQDLFSQLETVTTAEYPYNESLINVVFALVTSVRRKVIFFRQIGIKILSDPEYLAAKGRHEQLEPSLLQMLENNSILALESDVLFIRNLKRLIANTTKKNSFLNYYSNFNDFMQQKINSDLQP